MEPAHGVKVFLNNALVIPAGPITLVNWEAVERDTDGFWSSGDPSKLTLPASLPFGWWDVSVQQAWSKVAADVLVGVYPNGFQNGDIIRGHGPGAATTSTMPSHSGPWFAGPGEFLQMQVKNNGTADRTLFQDSHNTWLSLVYRGSL